ncbi:MAG: hypothetical protein ACD_23C01023G0004 [uncultured bacterium]|nr:MAG: hypothetical protein ACD_23C01023G0004 [uncultured bacterium]
MAYVKRKKMSTGIRLPPFTPIFNEELDSIAYQQLTGNAAKALPYFRRIHGILQKKLGDNFNGIFDLTYSEAEKFGFARRTFSRIITELIEKGFLDIIVQGGKRSCGMSNSKYRMSERWRGYGTRGFMKRPRHPCEP